MQELCAQCLTASNSIMNQKLIVTLSSEKTILSQKVLQWENLLTRFISQGRLINCLEVLKDVSLRDESAVFMLSAWEVL